MHREESNDNTTIADLVQASDQETMLNRELSRLEGHLQVMQNDLLRLPHKISEQELSKVQKVKKRLEEIRRMMDETIEEAERLSHYLTEASAE